MEIRKSSRLVTSEGLSGALAKAALSRQSCVQDCPEKQTAMLYRDGHADFTAAIPCQQVDCRRRSILRRPLDRQGCEVTFGLSSRRPAVGHERSATTVGFGAR